MVNRVGANGGKKGTTTLWRRPVKLTDIPKDTLYVSARWLVPFFPGEPEGNRDFNYYDPTATIFKFTTDRNENFNEVQAKHILTCPCVTYDDETGTYTIDNDDLQRILLHLETVNSEEEEVVHTVGPPTLEEFKIGDYILICAQRETRHDRYYVGKVIGNDMETGTFEVHLLNRNKNERRLPNGVLEVKPKTGRDVTRTFARDRAAFSSVILDPSTLQGITVSSRSTSKYFLLPDDVSVEYID